MDYALVIRALERHVGICQRALDFFRERRLGRQFNDQMIILDEANRALAETRKMRDFNQLQKDMFKAGIGPAPNPVPDDTSVPDLDNSRGLDFPDAKLSSGNNEKPTPPKI